MCQVTLSLHLKDSKAPKKKELLEMYGITDIVNLVSHKVENSFEGQYRYLNLKMGDRPGFSILHSALTLIDYIQNQPQDAKVLIHCRGGRSRSVALSVVYMMWKEGLNESDALAFVQSKHPECDPNLGFVGQLQTLSERFQLAKTRINPEES